MKNNQELLFLYIPIYNRSFFLERMLSRFLEDKELFDNDIYLTISDNCSTEDLKSICSKYQAQGLNVHYHCNGENIGADTNIMQGFKTAKGKYLWVLGSDDIPVTGFIPALIKLIKSNDYSYIHLAQYHKDSKGTIEYNDGEKFLEDINVWITFISDNIVKTEYVAKTDLNKYNETSLTQMPLFLNAALSKEPLAILYCPWIEADDDNAGNGGYNYFEVFVNQYLTILYDEVEKGNLTKPSYNKIKKALFYNHIVKHLPLLFGRNKNFQTNGGLPILFRHYGTKPYAYFQTVKYFINRITRR